ncbi:YebC/PmpR family DNA-binding transcriptional regulator [uncultured Umboniibacter sp.]|uniref:YebC/PmpR family DNA-binding transcriptional regulator n=1 Tax=uncultured Umboniibacter sp. TaxID=1798917 RepID=UPI002620A1CB|nr:YebC/PmpR family DNA-binding transcriptional regulator [uncultured Umboniibacter sp.]
MAGHSKWANIRHRKAAQDAKRGKVFTKLIRELVVAARAGGPIPDDNPRLRAAVDKALGANMKRDTIDKAIARGAGNAEGDNYDEIRYEGYAPGGVAVLVETMTDNRNRTVAEVRHCFSKRGGSLGTDGSVAYLFSRQGKIWVTSTDEDAVMELALEHGADDVELVEDAIEVSCDWTELLAVREALQLAGLSIASADVEMVPATQVELDAEAAEKVLAMIDALEDLDDVQNVYSNADFSQLEDA